MHLTYCLLSEYITFIDLITVIVFTIEVTSIQVVTTVQASETQFNI